MKEDGWNYRVMRHSVGGQVYYGLHEVYYKAGRPWLWSQEPDVQGDTIDELGSTLRMMINDFEKSKDDVLDFDGPGGDAA